MNKFIHQHWFSLSPGNANSKRIKITILSLGKKEFEFRIDFLPRALDASEFAVLASQLAFVEKTVANFVFGTPQDDELYQALVEHNLSSPKK